MSCYYVYTTCLETKRSIIRQRIVMLYNISSNIRYLSFVANKLSFRKLFMISCLKIMFVSFEFLIILRHASCIVITNIFHFNCLRGFIKLMTYYETANQNTSLLQSLIVYKAFWWSWLYYRAFVCMLKWRSHGSTCMDGINTARTLFTVSQRQRRK